MIDKDVIKETVVYQRGLEVDMRDNCKLIMSMEAECEERITTGQAT